MILRIVSPEASSLKLLVSGLCQSHLSSLRNHKLVCIVTVEHLKLLPEIPQHIPIPREPTDMIDSNPPVPKTRSLSSQGGENKREFLHSSRRVVQKSTSSPSPAAKTEPPIAKRSNSSPASNSASGTPISNLSIIHHNLYKNVYLGGLNAGLSLKRRWF